MFATLIGMFCYEGYAENRIACKEADDAFSRGTACACAFSGQRTRRRHRATGACEPRVAAAVSGIGERRQRQALVPVKGMS
jgi:hypothetical protein